MYAFPYHHIIDFDAVDYGRFAQTRNSPSGFRYASYLICTLEELDTLEFESLVDVGCGDGYFLKHAAARFPERRLVGMDISEPAILLAKALRGAGTEFPEFQCRDIVHDAPAETYDVATSIAVLEHIPPAELDAFVAAHRRLIRPEGTLIVVLPTKNLPIRNISRHYQHFNDVSIRATLSPHFEVERIDYLNNDRFWGRLLSVILTNRLLILNHRGLRERLFKWYMRRCVRCAESQGYTMLVRCRRPSDI